MSCRRARPVPRIDTAYTVRECRADIQRGLALASDAIDGSGHALAGCVDNICDAAENQFEGGKINLAEGFGARAAPIELRHVQIASIGEVYIGHQCSLSISRAFMRSARSVSSDAVRIVSPVCMVAPCAKLSMKSVLVRQGARLVPRSSSINSRAVWEFSGSPSRVTYPVLALSTGVRLDLTPIWPAVPGSWFSPPALCEARAC